ncbi:DUF4333 domain-containing protein [Nocardia sp. IFM 10818]
MTSHKIIRRSANCRMALLVAAALATLSACSCEVQVGNPQSPAQSVDPNVLATEVEKQVESKANTTVDSVSCHGPLEARVGATQHCDVVSGGSTYDTTVTAKSVSDAGQVDFDVQVSDTPKS